MAERLNMFKADIKKAQELMQCLNLIQEHPEDERKTGAHFDALDSPPVQQHPSSSHQTPSVTP